ncbi:MAG: hypothetical protein HON23_03475 [Rickettsiales bacterium]|jgi:hypothetical protein|nr:hypothetical protein [Rickettsiales bacterium]
MKIFAIYTKGSTLSSFKDIIVVQKSFNIWAGLLNVWWALFKRQYYLALIMFLLLILVGRLHDLEVVNEVGRSLILVYMMIVIGLESGGVVGSNLVKENYIYQELVMANNILDAKYQFSRNRL